MGYILDGRAVLTVDANDHLVSKGDSVHFDSHLPHQVRNLGKKPFRAVWCISPPHVDYLGSNDE